MEMNLHPICLILTEKGRVKYWKKSKDLHVFVKECTRLPPPSDSVAMEYLQQDYQFIYKFEEKAQRISKSTWFDLKSYDEDTDFYEYDLECLLNNALYGKHLSDTNFLTLLICLSILNN